MIDEKWLMRRMKENYRAGGYRVGTVMESGREMMMVSGGTWCAALPMARAGNDLKALVVLHTGVMPGRAVTVQKTGGAQLMMAGELEQIHADCMERCGGGLRCGKTPLLLGNYEIWQDGNGRCALYDRELTGIFMSPDGEIPEQTMTERLLIQRDAESELYVSAMECRGRQEEMLDHLGQFRWYDGEE